MNKLRVVALLMVAGCAVFFSNCKSDTNSTNSPVQNPTVTVPDTVEFSFVTCGCNRLDKADTNMASNPSTANAAQLNRLFTDLVAMDQKPAYLFFTGDMVLGKTTDTAMLARQLNGWKALYQQSPIATSGITLVPISGNHESNDGASQNASLENTWLSVMAPYIRGNNGPQVTAPNPDHLFTDQSKLTYSFDYKDSHFITVNTDAAGLGYQAPTHWIASDIAAARANPSIKHIFVFGHKPAYPFDYAVGGSDGLNNVNPALRDSLWSVLQAGKVEAMFAAHNHIAFHAQPTGSGTFMVIAGNSGSKLSSGANASQLYYGYALTQVMTNGKVIVKMIGHDLQAGGYNAPVPAATYPSSVRDLFEVTWKK